MQDLKNQFRPEKWKDVIGLNRSRIGNVSDKQILQELASTGRVRILMFVGPSGTGKTSVARLFAATYFQIECKDLESYPHYLEKNASGDRGIDIIRGDVQQFASIGTGDGKCRIIVLDEADGLTYQAQEALKAITEKWAVNCIFIFCLNKMTRMDEALKSRSSIFYFDPLPTADSIALLEKRAIDVGIAIKVGISDKIIEYYKGDLRRVVNDFLNVFAGQVVTRWDPRQTHADTIFKSGDPPEKYLELASKNYIDPTQLIHNLLILNNYKNPQIFGQASIMLNNGGDPMIAVLYALTGIKV